MNGLQWKYIKSLESPDLIAEYEDLVGYTFCDSFKECIVSNNGGRPDKRSFRTIKGNVQEIKSLLSFNKCDKETVWGAYYWDRELSSSYIPFAIDNFGNMICFDRSGKVVFVNHENEEIEVVADDFDTFLAMLR